MAGAPQLRLRNAFGKLVTQGDLDRCAGLLGRKAEVWILRATVWGVLVERHGGIDLYAFILCMMYTYCI